MAHHKPRIEDMLLTRRELLCRSGMGFGAMALGGLMAETGLVRPAEAEGYANPLAPRKPRFPAKAKRVIHIFANGGPSHVDTFDPNPLLDKCPGQPLPMKNLRTERKTGAAWR